jgi:folylpolyglutamate synthase/dihydropteroate synthase
MRTTISFILLFSSLAVFCSAQKLKEKDVPLKVKEALAKKFASIKVEEWEKENVNYEAEFDLNKEECSATFDENGIWLETETEIKPSALPKTAIDYLAKNVSGKKIKEASKIENAEGKISYEAEVNDVDYIFDEAGNFISKEETREGDKK